MCIDHTGRTLKQRSSEHLSAISKSESHKSVFAHHLLTTGHKLVNTEFPLLHSHNKGRILDRLEEIEIYRHSNNVSTINLLNDTKGARK